MVCSCAVPSKRVLLQIIFCSWVVGTTFSRETWQIASLSCQEVIKIWKQTWWSNDKTIIELGYRKIPWFVSVSQINYIIIDLLATDKSQYFAQPRPIIVNSHYQRLQSLWSAPRSALSWGGGGFQDQNFAIPGLPSNLTNLILWTCSLCWVQPEILIFGADQMGCKAISQPHDIS